MNFLESLYLPSSAPSIHSSEQYATAMIQGWIDGLQCLDIDDGNLNLESMMKVEYSKKSMFRWKPAGDIDLIMRFAREDIVLEDILPESGYQIRPEVAKFWKFKGLMCEAKRTCGIRAIDDNIKQIVKFYTGVLKRKKGFRLNGHIPDTLQEVIDDVNSPIVFLFNGADYADVWKRFLLEVPTGKICGRNLCIIFCLSDRLTTWENTILFTRQSEEDRRQKGEERRQKEEQIRLKEEERRLKEEQIRLNEEERRQKEEERRLKEEQIRLNEILMKENEMLKLMLEAKK